MTRRAAVRLGLVPAAAILLLLLLGGQVARASALFSDALPPNPYFVPGHAALLYGLIPLLFLAALVVVTFPGLFLMLAFGRTRATAPLVLKSALVAFMVNIAALGLLKLVVTAPSARLHGWLLMALDVATWAVLAVRVERGRVEGGFPGDAGRRWAWIALIPVLAAVLLLPVLFWQDLNRDGLETLTAGRSLTWFVLPRFPDGELPGLNLGMISSAYPVHWFIALFGLHDVAGRLPLLLYAPLIWAGLVALIEVRAPRRLAATEELAVVAGLAVFIAALAFNATYQPYNADITSPANIDFLAMAGVLATLYFFWNDEPGWFLFSAWFTHLTRPTGLLLLAMLMVGVVLFDRQRLRPRLLLLAAAIGLMVAWTAGFEQLLTRFAGIPIDGTTGAVAARYRYLRFDDVQRLLWVIVPAGIVPVLALPLFRRQDGVSRALVVVTVLYFVHFYVLAFTALHHFAPAMLLPIVVFWRLALKTPSTGRRVAVTLAGAGLALVLALPRSFEPDRSMRAIGRETVWNVGDYAGDYDTYRYAFDHNHLLDALFPGWWEVEDPARRFVGAPWPQIRYSRHGAIGPETNYVAQPLSDAAPAGFTRIAEDSVAALWVRDPARLEADRTAPRNTEWQSPVLRVRREVLFKMLGAPLGMYNVDLKRVVDRLRGR